jgi:hypothetical protein
LKRPTSESERVASDCIIAPELWHGYVFRPAGSLRCGAGTLILPRLVRA